MLLYNYIYIYIYTYIYIYYAAKEIIYKYNLKSRRDHLDIDAYNDKDDLKFSYLRADRDLNLL